ncbi:MAG: type I phosphomannose isomerase catalytic subunit [Ruthenibacterium sp.]
MMFRLSPVCKDYLWGGQILKTAYHKAFQGDILAESWELSCHPDGESVLASGACAGQTLKHWLDENGGAGTACDKFETFPVLIKLIDAAKDLSIQVHPSDAYAQEHEHQFGKTEMWYIVRANPDASLYYGFESEISKEDFRAAIAQNTLCDLLHKVPVKAGDVFFIESGTIHAIGAGIVIAEIQQSSNVTYRVYDYGRVGADGKPRALHIDKACDVTTLAPAVPKQCGEHLAKCDYFTVDKLTLDGAQTHTADASSFHALLCVDGGATLTCGGETLTLQEGDTVFISAGSGDYTLTGAATLLLTYVQPAAYRIGIDLGGTNIKAGIVDENNHIIAKYSIPTRAERPWQAVAADMAEAVKAALAKANLSLADCVSVGVGCPGTVDAATGNVPYSNNLAWENAALGDTLAQALGLPVRVSNDANCAALGEFVAGAAAGVRSAVLLTLGTGVGGGVVFDGKIFEGGPGGAELGHSTLIAGGAPCTCGRNGCLEAYASATALVREARSAAQAHPESVMNTMCAGNLDKMNGRIPFDAARANDAAGKAVVAQYIEWLGEGIVNMVNIFRPEVVLLSGGICGEGRYLTDPLNAFVQKYAFAGKHAPIPPVLCATLGNDAGILGAANLNSEK